jgi:hypothetical protein
MCLEHLIVLKSEEVHKIKQKSTLMKCIEGMLKSTDRSLNSQNLKSRATKL